MNRTFEIIDGSGEFVGTITRALKNIPLYEISIYKAVDEIDWDASRRVSYTETRLIMYLIGGKRLVDKFEVWAHEVEKYEKEYAPWRFYQ